MFGREAIFSPVEEVNESNVVNVLQTSLLKHSQNSAQMDYLYSYYRGIQPILSRVKTIRPEINNKIVENHALEIVSFKTGYVFGEPVQYVRRGEGDGVSEKITQLNEFMFSEGKPARDKELAEWFSICGTSYRMVLPSDDPLADSPFQLDSLDPRFAFVVYSNRFGKRPLMGVKYITDENDVKLYSVYTINKYFEIKGEKITKNQDHVLGVIPIIEYPANSARLGAFEVVLGLLDAINTTASNRLDGIEQFVQAFMKFINCDIDEEQFIALAQMGAIKIKGEPGNPADVDIVSRELNQSQIQVTKDDIYQMILIICGMPDRNGSSTSTGDTGQAVILRDGWSSAESRARDTELEFKESEKLFLKLVLRIVRDSAKLDLKIGDIDIKFTRNKTDNLLVKTQGLQNMLEAGINPQIAIANSGLFSDPEQTYLDSVEYLKKWLAAPPTVTPSNQKENPKG